MAKVSANSGKAKPNETARRRRFPKAIPDPGCGEQPYAKKREELKSVTEADIVLWVMETPEWADWMKPILEAVDRERAEKRRGRRGGQPAYSAEELERALLFGKICGYRTYAKTHMRLCADRRMREALGFTRANSKKASRYAEGVPSRATISRHLRRFGKERRGDAWDRLWRLLRDVHVANFPEMREEMRVSYADGSAIKTHFTTPIIDPKTSKVVNASKVTCHDGGYMPPSAGEEKSGNGWNLIPLLTRTGVPWAAALPKIHESEKVETTKLINGEARDVIATIPNWQLGVVTADGGFHSPALRQAFRDIGFIENIHTVSHRNESKPRAEALRKKRIPIEDYPNWFSDGHYQLVCKCGEGKIFRRLSPLNDTGDKAVARVEGQCANCGSITITSGKWRLAQNPARWTRVDPSNPDDIGDLLFGNPFTFDDLLANEYGNGRFGRNEGMFGVLWKRWRLGDKRWFRTAHDARAEIGMIFTIIHVVAMEQRRRKAALALAEQDDG